MNIEEFAQAIQLMLVALYEKMLIKSKGSGPTAKIKSFQDEMEPVVRKLFDGIPGNIVKVSDHQMDGNPK